MPRRFVAFATAFVFAQLTLGQTPMRGAFGNPTAAMPMNQGSMPTSLSGAYQASADVAGDGEECSGPADEQLPCGHSGPACASMITCSTPAIEVALVPLTTTPAAGWVVPGRSRPMTNPSLSRETPPPRG